MTLNPNDLNNEVIRQSGLTYHYSAQLAKAERQRSRLKLRLELKEAEVAQRIRVEAKDTNEKLTVAQVDERVRRDSEVTALELAFIDAEEVAAVLKGAVNALKEKSSSLITHVTMHRDELKARLTFNEEGSSEELSDVRDRGKAVRDRLANNK